VSASFAKSQNLISREAKGRSPKELLWVERTPERSWKSSLTLRACVEEGPGESGLPMRVTCVRVVSEL
jgi:hypothetical protein